MLAIVTLSHGIWRSVWLLVWVGLMAGCAHQPSISPTLPVDSQVHQQSLASYKNWTIQGKIGFKSPEKKQSASLRWLQTRKKYQLNLTSILGSSILSMQGDEQNVLLKVGKDTYQDTDASFLIWRTTGWEIPVEHFPTWVKGAYRNQDHVVLSDQGWVTQLNPSCSNCEQWEIHYSAYQFVEKRWLPHKITLKNKMNNSQLLIKVNTWN
jgi:outer membrane lipoprotein LolB